MHHCPERQNVQCPPLLPLFFSVRPTHPADGNASIQEEQQLPKNEKSCTTNISSTHFQGLPSVANAAPPGVVVPAVVIVEEAGGGIAPQQPSPPVTILPPLAPGNSASGLWWPSLEEVCAAPWSTLPYDPPQFRDELERYFCRTETPVSRNAIREKLVCPCKGLLASVRHGGKARAKAVSRILRNRFRLWQSGAIHDLWKRLHDDHKSRSPANKKYDEQQLEREARRVAQLVDEGMLSRAAAQLCSRGLAPNNTETARKLSELFPQETYSLDEPPPHAPSFSIQPELVRKLILRTPKGLAPGCSGMRAEHLKALLLDRNSGLAAQALALLTTFVNDCVNGNPPTALQPYLCGGRLIPLNKKDAGVRPLVVGEYLRAIVAKAALKQVDHHLMALQPLQVGVGGKGPIIQAAVLAVVLGARAQSRGNHSQSGHQKCIQYYRSACLYGRNRTLLP